MRILFLAVLALSLSACKKNYVSGEGPITSVTRHPDAFSRIELSGAESLIVTPDAAIRVEITGYENLLPFYETSISDGVLRLRFKENTNARNSNIQVRVYTPGLASLALAGSGSANVQNGSNLQLQSASIDGSGEIQITQPAVADRDLEINGSGKILARDAAGSSVSAKIFGSGRIETTATNTLNVHINGSGEVHYWGAPQLSTEINGSGKVVGH